MSEDGGPLQPLAPEVGAVRSGVASRGPPKAVRILLPVWGGHHIGLFLRTSLPTLLAPGNLPAVASELPCTFGFLTTKASAEALSLHPAVCHLRTICNVEMSPIDDLITGDNHSTTITLAFARAVRAAGEAMLDTCFVFLTSDYLMADGSLRNVLARIQAGCNGVVAGNFQVSEEQAAGSFFETFDTGQPAIVLRARDLMRWSLDFLHPMTLANMVDFALCHSAHSNRLFWRVDENTILGRFYLLHMICIRPEVTSFEVGSSCDYSFIPEMCPSGRVHVMSDTDEYMVVEMQKDGYERHFLRLGPVDRKALAESLAEWTTAVHRNNAHSPIVFHATDLPPDLAPAVRATAALVDDVERSLPPLMPHRNHPYWIGAIAAHRAALSKDRDAMQAPGASWRHDILVGGRAAIFGRQPHVRPWHPRWQDYRAVADLAGRYFSGRDGRMLVVSSSPTLIRGWLDHVSRAAESVHLSDVLAREPDNRGSLDGCLLVLKEGEIPLAKALVESIKPMLKPQRHLLVFVQNGHELMLGAQFTDDMLRSLPGFFDRGMPIEEACFVPAGWLRWSGIRAMRRAFQLAANSVVWILLLSLLAVPLLAVCLAGNLFTRRTARPIHERLYSSVTLVLRKHGADASKKREVAPSLFDLAAERFAGRAPSK